MNSRTKILTFAILVILAGLFGIFKLNKNMLLFWNVNNISVTADNPLITDKVKIEFGVSVNTISRENDLDLFEDKDKYTVIYDGRFMRNIFNEYGENDYLITYDDQYYLSFRHFKFNRRHQHDYDFHLYENDNGIYVKASIDGQDKMTFDKPMIRIDSAEFYRCNVLVDRTGDVYNMTELTDRK